MSNRNKTSRGMGQMSTGKPRLTGRKLYEKNEDGTYSELQPNDAVDLESSTKKFVTVLPPGAKTRPRFPEFTSRYKKLQDRYKPVDMSKWPPEKRVEHFVSKVEQLAEENDDVPIAETTKAFRKIADHPFLTIKEKDEFFSRANLNDLTTIQPDALKILRDADVRKDLGLYPDMSIEEARAKLPELAKHVAKTVAERATLREEREALLTEEQALNDLLEWSAKAMTLQANECSRMHKLVEFIKGRDDEAKEYSWDVIEPFVVRHDWLAAFGDSLGEVQPGELKLPYPMTAFEFKFSQRVVIAIVTDHEITGQGLTYQWFVEAKNGAWVGFSNDEQPISGVMALIRRQISAICVMLDSKVAEVEIVRQPTKLQDKRKASGKLPLYDYHVIDLSRRHRAARNPNPLQTGRHVRCHFRRGHWRHFTAHKTWITWMLVGDPDLGFVDKEYRL